MGVFRNTNLIILTLNEIMKNQTGERRKNTGKKMMKGDEWVRLGERGGRESEEKEGNRRCVLKKEGIRKFKAALQGESEGGFDPHRIIHPELRIDPKCL